MQSMTLRFQPSQELELMNRYKGTEDPEEHIWFCQTRWTEKGFPRQEWVHRFIQTQDSVPRSWYVQEETRRQTGDWELVSRQFCATFRFASEDPALTGILQQIKQFLFNGAEP